MSEQTHFSLLINELSKQFGLNEPEDLDKGIVAFQFDDRITVNLKFCEENDTLLIYTNLDPIPNDKRADGYAKLLKQNAFADVEQPTFALTPKNDRVQLTQCKYIRELNLQKLQRLLEHFLNACDYWLDGLSNSDDEDTQAHKVKNTTPAKDGPDWMKI